MATKEKEGKVKGMKVRVKKLWLKALLSGEYKQGKYALKDNVTGGYCCLGVLADLYCKEEGKRFPALIKKENNVLPIEVMKWAGLKSTNPDVIYRGKKENLARLNDRVLLSGGVTGLSFPAIARVIEKRF